MHSLTLQGWDDNGGKVINGNVNFKIGFFLINFLSSPLINFFFFVENLLLARERKFQTFFVHYVDMIMEKYAQWRNIDKVLKDKAIIDLTNRKFTSLRPSS